MNNPLPQKTLREIAEEYRREQENLANRREAAKQAEQIKLVREQFERFIAEAHDACSAAARQGKTCWIFGENIQVGFTAMVQDWLLTDVTEWVKQNNISWRVRIDRGDMGDSAAPTPYEYNRLELSW